jgi:creatinine amidohydrolase
VPIGATESHGPHLPLGTDTYEAVDCAEGIARAHGDAAHAAVEKGRALWDAVIANGVGFIEDMRRFSGARHEESVHT